MPVAGGGPIAFEGDDRGVSDVVGNILMVGITVGLAAALAGALVFVPTPGDPVSADLVVSATGDTVLVRHVGGEPVAVDDGRFRIDTADDAITRPLSDYADHVSDGRADRWELGETVCLSCETPPTDRIDGIAFVAGGEVILSWTRGA